MKFNFSGKIIWPTAIERSATRLIILLLVSTLLVFAGCGDDNDNESDGGVLVTRLNIDNSLIPLGEATIARIGFSFSSDDVFDDDRNVLIAVQLPFTVQYLVGSAEIQRPIDDHQIDPSITVCPDGSSFLAFDFNEGDLADAENPDGNTDAELTLTVDTLATGTGEVTAAAAADSILTSCDIAFFAQESAVLSVQ